MRHTRRVAVLVLSLALLAPWAASAAVSGPEPVREAAASFWSWLTHLWAGAGCIIDPNGCASAQRDEGCILDPSGCAEIQGDEGCILDPDGCMGAAGSADNGCGADPNGAACAEGR